MNLIEAMRDEYSRSKRWLAWAIGLSVAMYAIALLNEISSSSWITKAFVIIAAVIQLGLFGCRYVGGKHLQSGEEIRRLAMLQDGLGVKPAAIQIARLRERIAEHHNPESDYVGAYYESESPQGPRRLLEITEESAFFTECLARSAAGLFGGIAVGGLLIVVFVFVLAVQGGISQPALETSTKVFLASMAFWTTGDLGVTALTFSALSRACERVANACTSLLSQHTTSDQAHAVVCEYHCALAQSPPIPEFIWNRRKDRLNKAWKERRSLDS